MVVVLVLPVDPVVPLSGFVPLSGPFPTGVMIIGVSGLETGVAVGVGIEAGAPAGLDVRVGSAVTVDVDCVMIVTVCCTEQGFLLFVGSGPAGVEVNPPVGIGMAPADDVALGYAVDVGKGGLPNAEEFPFPVDEPPRTAPA